MAATVRDGACTADSIDSVSAVHGFRSLHYTANDGFFLNKVHFKVRGFCDHNNFAVVGMVRRSIPLSLLNMHARTHLHCVGMRACVCVCARAFACVHVHIALG